MTALSIDESVLLRANTTVASITQQIIGELELRLSEIQGASGKSTSASEAQSIKASIERLQHLQNR